MRVVDQVRKKALNTHLLLAMVRMASRSWCSSSVAGGGTRFSLKYSYHDRSSGVGGGGGNGGPNTFMFGSPMVAWRTPSSCRASSSLKSSRKTWRATSSSYADGGSALYDGLRARPDGDGEGRSARGNSRVGHDGGGGLI